MTTSHIFRLAMIVGVVILASYTVVVTSFPNDVLKVRPFLLEHDSISSLDSRDRSSNTHRFAIVKKSFSNKASLEKMNSENTDFAHQPDGSRSHSARSRDVGKLEVRTRHLTNKEETKVQPVETNEDSKSNAIHQPKVQKQESKNEQHDSQDFVVDNSDKRMQEEITNNKERKVVVNTKKKNPKKQLRWKTKNKPRRKPQRKKKLPRKLKRKNRHPRPKKILPEQVMTQEEREHLENKLSKSFGMDYPESPQYQNIIKRCSEYPQHRGRILFYDTSRYLETQSHLCDGAPDILIAIHTRPESAGRRHLIRDTYGSMRNINGKRIVLAFFLGSSGNSRLEKQVQQEAKDYRDIIQRNFKENYRNMTYKHLTVMEWIMDFCPHVKYLVKADDDVFINVFQVVEYIESFNPTGFYCTRTVGPKPMRKGGKWKVTYDEYSRPTFPPYCMGYAYIMKASHAKSIYWCSVYSKFLWIDDVLVGGLLPEKLQINLQRFISGHNSAYILPSHASSKIVDFMFLLGTRDELFPGDIRKIWRASLKYSY